jgi:hypothetical protein
MAHPYLKITNNKTDYYLIWDTFYELPETIPMDLATFIAILNEKKWSFTGLIAAWKNLHENNISLDGMVLSEFLKEKEYEFLIKQSEDEYTASKELNHRALSEQIKKKMNELSNRYQSSIPLSSEEELETLLSTLQGEFYKFLEAEIIHNVKLLPLRLYKNLNETFDLVVDHLRLGKSKDFWEFMYSSAPVSRKSVEWYSKLFFHNNLYWDDIPHSVRKKYTISSNKLAENDSNCSFNRQNGDIKLEEIEHTATNLLGYLNHAINENFNFAKDILSHLQKFGLLKEDQKLIQLQHLEYALNQNLIDISYLPYKLFNICDNDGGMLLPPIYTDYHEVCGLIKFDKYNLGLIDVYSKNGDLIFANLDAIEIVEKDNQIFTFYLDNDGRKIYKQIIIEQDNPVQLQNIRADIGDELFKFVFDYQFENNNDLFITERDQDIEDNLPF